MAPPLIATASTTGWRRERLELLETVGRGGQGTVHLAADLDLERLVAVKELCVESPEHADDLLARCSRLEDIPAHPHLCRMLAHLRIADEVWSVMEWVDGDNTARLAATGRLGARDALSALGRAASALAHLHSCGLAHGDVKPSNLMVAASGRTVLVDLGSIGTATRSGGFSAPDQRPHSPEADVWSLAASAVFLLTGAAPRLGGAPPLPAELPAPTRGAILSALSVDHRRRPTASGMADALAVAADTDVTLAADIENLSPGGRARDLRRVIKGLQSRRLITICGPNGVGKSTLASAAAAWLARRSEVIAIDVTAAATAGDVSSVLASRLGISSGGEPGSPLATLSAATALDARRATLLLDGCEHIGTDIATLVDALINQAPSRWSVLATSVEPLGAATEHVVVIDPLPVPVLDTPGAVIASPAGALALRRWRDIHGQCELGTDLASMLSRLARAGDGLPLAVELLASDAANAANHGGTAADRGVTNRLTAAVTETFARLPPPLATSVGWLSMFRDPFEAEDAACLLRLGRDGHLAATPVEPLLDDLVRRSVLHREPDGRHRLLSALRAPASALLSTGRAAAELAFGRWAAKTALGLGAMHGTPAMSAGLQELTARVADVPAGIVRLVHTDPDAAVDAAVSITPLLLAAAQHGMAASMLSELEVAAPNRPELPALLAQCRQLDGDLVRADQDLARARQRAEEADHDTLCQIEHISGHVLADRGRMPEAGAAYQRALSHARQAGNSRGAIDAMIGISSTLALDGGALGDARRMLEDAATLARETDNPAALGSVMLQLATVLRSPQAGPRTRPDMPATELDALSAADALAERIGHQHQRSMALSQLSAALAWDALDRGTTSPEAAGRVIASAMDLCRRAGNLRSLSLCHRAAAMAAEATADLAAWRAALNDYAQFALGWRDELCSAQLLVEIADYALTIGRRDVAVRLLVAGLHQASQVGHPPGPRAARVRERVMSGLSGEDGGCDPHDADVPVALQEARELLEAVE